MERQKADRVSSSTSRFRRLTLDLALCAGVFAFLGGLLFAPGAAASATNIYLAQSAAGTANGTSCSNAYAYTFFNNSVNWGSGSAQIGPGTTVHLCGTFSFPAGTSGALTVQGSGTAANVIRIQFESGALATAPYWGSNGFITVTGNGFIQIDGSPSSTPCGYVNSQDVACNGTIQATANGAALTNHASGSRGISLGNGTHDVEVQNLYCQHLFVPVQNSSTNETTAGVNNSACVFWLSSSGGGNINVHNNQIDGSFNGVLLAYEGSNAGMHVDNNWMTNIEVGAQIGAGQSNSTITSGSIHGNDFSNMANWDVPGDPNHHEFIHLYTQQPGATISNFTIDGNYFHGTLGAYMTALVYVECDGGSSCTAPTSIQVNEFNNVVVNEDSSSDISTGAGGNTMTECEGSTCNIYNNTYFSPGQFSSLNCAVHLEMGSVVTVKNNIFDGMNCAISNGGGTVTASSNLGFGLAASCGSACSVTGDPKLSLTTSPKYQLTDATSAAYLTGSNFGSLNMTGLLLDQLRVPRPAAGAGPWTMGAFESSGPPPNPPRTLQAVVQ